MTRAWKQFSTVVLSSLIVFGFQTAALAQGGEHDGDRIRGRITSITGNSIDIARRDGSTARIVTTGQTTFVRNGQPATLDDFVAGDFIVARGQQNGEGVFVADAVRGGERPPRPPSSDRVGGSVVSVDTAGGSITVTTRDGATETIYTTEETRIMRDRQPATLADFVAGDRVRASGERDPNDNFVADRILGASGASQ